MIFAEIGILKIEYFLVSMLETYEIHAAVLRGFGGMNGRQTDSRQYVFLRSGCTPDGIQVGCPIRN